MGRTIKEKSNCFEFKHNKKKYDKMNHAEQKKYEDKQRLKNTWEWMLQYLRNYGFVCRAYYPETTIICLEHFFFSYNHATCERQKYWAMELREIEKFSVFSRYIKFLFKHYDFLFTINSFVKKEKSVDFFFFKTFFDDEYFLLTEKYMTRKNPEIFGDLEKENTFTLIIIKNFEANTREIANELELKKKLELKQQLKEQKKFEKAQKKFEEEKYNYSQNDHFD